MKSVKLRWRMLANLRRHVMQMKGCPPSVVCFFNAKNQRHFFLLRHGSVIAIGLYYFMIMFKIRKRIRTRPKPYQSLLSAGYVRHLASHPRK